MELNDLLKLHDIDPKTVLVMRHRPKEPEIRKVLPWLAAERPDTYNAWQQTQYPRAEKAMQRAEFVASFIGHRPGKALFVGLYRRGDCRPLTHKEYWSMPVNNELGAFGMRGFIKGSRDSVLWFDLECMDFYSSWKGKLVVDWPGLERSWYRWSNRNCIPISVIHEQSLLDEEMPAWDELILSWEELKVLPSSWKAALGQWRGVYLIFDVSDGKGYVGSAYGEDNIQGRWLNYAARGHGGNKKLRGRDCSRFRFSILQRVSPDMEPRDVIRLESAWKDRLHTREFGLNDN